MRKLLAYVLVLLISQTASGIADDQAGEVIRRAAIPVTGGYALRVTSGTADMIADIADTSADEIIRQAAVAVPGGYALRVADTVGTGNGGIIGDPTGGTAGSALFVGPTGNLAQDNAKYFWDVTNHRLGIGTTAPGQSLTVDGNFGILEGGSSPTFHTIFQGGDQAGNITYTLPTADGSSGKVLSTNGSGVLSWITAPGGTPSIGGTLTSATAGSVLFAGTATFAQDNSKFFWDDTNFRLGIGTTSPAGMLDVEGGTAAATTDGTAIKIIAQGAGSGGNNSGGAIYLTPGALVGTGKGGAIRASTTGNARGSYAVDLQSDRFDVVNVASGQFSTIPGGSGNEASGKASFVAGYQNTANADYSVAIAYQSLASGTQSVVFGAGNVASGSNSATLGGQNDAASASYATTLGGHANGAAHQYSLAGGGGALTTSNFDVVFGNSAGGSSAGNVHFRIDGGTSDVHIGRETDQSAVASASNQLELHTIFATHQSRSVSLKAPDTLAASYVLTLPADDGLSGQRLLTDGAGTLYWAGADPITGTANTVATFNGAGALTASSTLFNDAGNAIIQLTAPGPPGAGSMLFWPGGTTPLFSLDTGDMFDTGNILSIDIGNRDLSRSDGSTSIAWDNSWLRDDSAKTALDWLNRVLNDTAGNTSADWANRQLIRSTGSLSMDWENSTLNDADGTAVMNYAPAPTILSAGGSGGNIPYSCTTRTAATGTATSACSAGEIATGGGVNCGNTALFLSDSIPTGGPPSTGWAGSCTSLLNVVTNTTISVSVICCKY